MKGSKIENKTPLFLLRKNAGLSQNTAAELLGIGMTTLFRYESGENDIPFSTAEDMAIIYHVPFDVVRKAINDTKSIRMKNLFEEEGNNFKISQIDKMPLAKLRIRYDVDLTVSKAAQKMGITSNVLMRYENGISDVPAQIIDKMSFFYGVSRDVVLQAVLDTWARTHTAGVADKE